MFLFRLLSLTLQKEGPQARYRLHPFIVIYFSKCPLNIIYQVGLLFVRIVAGAGVGGNGVCCVYKSALIAESSFLSVVIRLDSLIQVYRTLTQCVVIESLCGQCRFLAHPPLAHIMRIFTFLSTTDLER